MFGLIRCAVIIVVGLLSWSTAAPATLAAQDSSLPSATALVDRLLAQVGGRDVWAAASGFHMVEILYSESLPVPAIREYWVDFERPRIMQRMDRNGVDELQALNGSEGWLLRNGELSDWPAETVQGWSSFWPGIPTRVFHLMATQDPGLEVRVREGNRLDVYVDGQFAVWIATDDEGTPVAYGREEAHTFTHFLGRMEDYGPVRLWTAAYEPLDLWRVTMVDYELFEGELPVRFDAPLERASHRPAPVRGGVP